MKDRLAAGPKFHESLAHTWTARYASGSFRRRLDFLRQDLQGLPTKGLLWLDAGCGSGVFTRELVAAGASVVAVDASPRMLAEVRKQFYDAKSVVEIIEVKTIEQIPLPEQTFDGIVCLSVIEYVDNPSDAVKELARLLKKGSPIFITVPNRWSVVRGYQRAIRAFSTYLNRNVHEYLLVSKHSFSRLEIEQTLSSAGFQDVKLRMFSTVLPRVLTPCGIGAMWCATARKA